VNHCGLRAHFIKLRYCLVISVSILFKKFFFYNWSLNGTWQQMKQEGMDNKMSLHWHRKSSTQNLRDYKYSLNVEFRVFLAPSPSGVSPVQ
jgi:hypothetical protein